MHTQCRRKTGKMVSKGYHCICVGSVLNKIIQFVNEASLEFVTGINVYNVCLCVFDL